MMGSRRHGRTGFRSDGGSTGRQVGRSILAGVALCLMAVIGVSCGGSSESSALRRPCGPQRPRHPQRRRRTRSGCAVPGSPTTPARAVLTTTVVSADGTSTTEAAAPAEDPPIDCFYVYPTVSGQTTENANLEIDPEEKAIAVQQASRFSQVCKVYAPMYRQLTLTAINSGTGDTPEARALAYGDVLSAWQDYLAHYNDGRGVVFIGHSQGTIMLTHLIATEIDPNPERASPPRLGAADRRQRDGRRGSGCRRRLPEHPRLSVCRSDGLRGGLLQLRHEPPPPDACFGRVDTGPQRERAGRRGSGGAVRQPGFAFRGNRPAAALLRDRQVPRAIGPGAPATPSAPTPWVAYPGLYTAHCESSGGANWLQVDTTNIAGDQRPVV